MQCCAKSNRTIKKLKYIFTTIALLVFAAYTSSLLLRIDTIQQFVASSVSEGIREFGKLPLEIGSVRIRHLNKIEINDILLNDQAGDTMANVKKLTLHVSPLRLLQEQIRINTITLAKPDIRIYREVPDSCLNLQFIIDLFASKDSSESIIPNTRINQLQIYDGKVTYDVRSKERLEDKLDINHIAISDINTNISLKKLANDTISLYIRNIAAKEASGLQIKNFRAHFNASDKGCKLERFRLELPNSKLRSKELSVTLDWDKENKKIKELSYTGEVELRPLTPRDIQALSPILSEIPNVNIKSRFSGTGDRIAVDKLHAFTKDSNIQLTASGDIERGAQGAIYNIEIPELKINEEGYRSIYPLLPEGVAKFAPHKKLGSTTLSGEFHSKESTIKAKAEVSTGSGRVNATFNLNEQKKYAIRLKGRGIDLQTIIANNNFGVCNVEASADGRYYSSKRFNGKYTTDIKSIDFKEYRYENIGISGEFDNEKASAIVASNDRNITLDAKATYELRDGTPNIKFKAQIDSLRLNELKLSQKNSNENISFDLQAEFSGKGIDRSIISADVYDFNVTSPEDTLAMHHLHIRSNTIDERRSLYLDSDIMQGYLLGDFNYSTLAGSVQRIMEQTLPSLTSKQQKSGSDNKYVFRYEINNSEILNHFVNIPIKINDVSFIEGNCDDSFNHIEILANLKSADIMGSRYNSVQISGKGDHDKIVCNGEINLPIKKKIDRSNIIHDNITIKSQSIIRDDSIKNNFVWDSTGEIQTNGKLNFNIGIDKNENDNTEFSIHILPGIITNDGEMWTLSESNIYSDADKFHIKNLAVHNNDKRLSINGAVGKEDEDSLKVNLSKIDIGKLMGIVNFRPVALDGIATGDVNVSRILKTPKLNSHLRVDNFKFENGYMGEMIFDGRWDEENKAVVLNANIIDGTTASTLVDGFVSPANDTIELRLKAHNTRLEFLNHLLSGIMYDVEGVANGHLYIRGPLKDINLFGALAPTGQLSINHINTTYKIVGDTVRFDYNVIGLDNFRVKDIYGNSGILNGGVYHKTFKDFSCKFDIVADNMLAYYSSDFSTLPFYGTAFVTGNASLNVDSRGISLSTDVKANKGSKIVYNSSGPEGATENNFVTFVDRNKVNNNKEKEQLSLTNNKLSSDLRLDFMIDVSPETLVRVYTNTVTDDYLDIYGSGAINAIYDSRDGFTMQGNMELERGTYKFTFQDIFPKEFNIKSGSTLIFNGDPYYANLNLKAVYTVPSVPLTDLSLTAERRKNVKVDCLMDITGTLASPNLAFSLELPDANEEEREMLANATSTQEQTTMQFIYLLGIGKFYTYDYNNQGQSTTAMESLFSSTISGQLNNMLSQITDNDNWNLSGNFSTNERGWNSMEVEGILSGRLLDNRLLVNGNFGYRNNPIDNKNFIGDFEVEWLLNKKGNISLKAYNKTNDRYFSKTTLTTQGAGIMLRHEFNKWLFWIKDKEKKETKKEEEQIQNK